MDKAARIVTLNDIEVTKAKFPSVPERRNNYLALIRKHVPTVSKTVALESSGSPISGLGSCRRVLPRPPRTNRRLAGSDVCRCDRVSARCGQFGGRAHRGQTGS